jgi:hypothetical protein
MDALTKQIWLARVIALVLMALLMVLLTGRLEPWSRSSTHEVRIAINGDPNEIFAAIVKLDLPDVHVRVEQVPWYVRTSNPVPLTLVMIFSLGLMLGFYHTIYSVVWSLLGRFHSPETPAEDG